ncbi:phage regulatory protein/antirepressor Ant [Acidovorax sp. sif1233]|uniref:phage regulatory protein/antirepressor Ant n=1 Tax=Acidovorax sp. sif1233 TaxID=2854792 RepID=UPI001C467DFC|nr:phage regulatory protein/antirepressor Ant [Acidovorax sp. sif1233]MBV7457326.1 phage regulatory protein/antirepressor Ant [Acidovorax sp. sif1233]
MNALTHLAGSPLTMTSREIAGLVGKEHFHVMRDIRALRDQLGALFGGAIQNWRHPQNGQTYEEFALEKDTCLTLLLGYDPVARMKVVKRWQELEAGRVPQSFAQALRLAAEQQEQIELQQAALAAARPKVVYADAMLNADGTVLVRDAAKTIGVPVRKLERALREKGVILPDNAPAARYVAQGYFKEAVHHYDTKTNGRQLSRVARVTGRGLEFLRRFVARHPGLLWR